LANHDFQNTTLSALADLNGKLPGADPSHLGNLSSMSSVLSKETGKALLSDIFSDNSGTPGSKTQGP